MDRTIVLALDATPHGHKDTIKVNVAATFDYLPAALGTRCDPGQPEIFFRSAALHGMALPGNHPLARSIEQMLTEDTGFHDRILGQIKAHDQRIIRDTGA